MERTEGESESESERERGRSRKEFWKPTKYQILFPEQEVLVLFVCFVCLVNRFDCTLFGGLSDDEFTGIFLNPQLNTMYVKHPTKK